MVFTAYSVENIKRFNVAGGGLQNGNAYADIEVEYEGDSEYWLDNVKKVWYIEYGKNYMKRLIGNDIEWTDEPDDFKVLLDGKSVDIFGDSEDEEEEEEEEEEPTFAKAIILGAGANKAKKITWGINTKQEDLDLYFPKAKVPMGLDRIEYWTTQGKTGIFDYYVVMYDGHNEGEPNQISKFITNVLPDGVCNTGNFVILHKVWKNDKEFNTDITIGLKELKKLFT